MLTLSELIAVRKSKVETAENAGGHRRHEAFSFSPQRRLWGGEGSHSSGRAATILRTHRPLPRKTLLY